MTHNAESEAQFENLAVAALHAWNNIDNNGFLSWPKDFPEGSREGWRRVSCAVINTYLTSLPGDDVATKLRTRLDYINCHAEMEGATYSTANTVEILEIANTLLSRDASHTARIAELEKVLQECVATIQVELDVAIRSYAVFPKPGSTPDITTIVDPEEKAEVDRLSQVIARARSTLKDKQK